MTLREILGTLLALLIIAAVMAGGFLYQFQTDYPFIEPLISSVKRTYHLTKIQGTSYQCRLSSNKDSVHFSLELTTPDTLAVVNGFAVGKNSEWIVLKSTTKILHTHQQ